MASGQLLARFVPPGEPPPSSYATFDTRNAHPVLDCDAASGEWIYWTDVMPANWSGGAVTVRVYWSATSATSGDVALLTKFERMEDEGTDVDADSFDTNTSVVATAPATSGALQYTDIPVAVEDMDDIAVGELYRLMVERNGAAGSDTMTGDLEIHAVTIRES